MKLSDWAKTQGISYLTAYRWFKSNTLPVHAYQTDSGTIIVKQTDPYSEIKNNNSENSISTFIKKTIEYSNNNSTIEDFAAYVLSNFTLQPNNINKVSLNEPNKSSLISMNSITTNVDLSAVNLSELEGSMDSSNYLNFNVAPSNLASDYSFNHEVTGCGDAGNNVMLVNNSFSYPGFNPVDNNIKINPDIKEVPDKKPKRGRPRNK